MYFILLAFWFRRSDSISEIWYLFQIRFTKKKPLYTDPQLLINVSVATVTMAVNSPEPTLLCVIMFCICLYSLYNQDASFRDFFVLFVIVVVAVIVVGNHLLGMDWLVVIPLGTIIYLQAGGAGVGGVSFVRLLLLFVVIFVMFIVVGNRLFGRD